MSTNFTGIPSAAAAEPRTAAPLTSGSERIANKETFLQLLVAQLKYQNPMNPADGMEFVTQLSQFTELEQVMGMRQDLAAVRKALEVTAPDAASSAPATAGSVAKPKSSS